MSLHLFDTASRTLRPFEPLEPGRVGLYICGLTTQGSPHIGHVRSSLNYDVLRRWIAAGSLAAASSLTTRSASGQRAGSEASR